MIKPLLLRIGYWLLEKDPPPEEVDDIGLPVIRNASLEDILDEDSYVNRMDRLRKQVEEANRKNDELSEKVEQLDLATIPGFVDRHMAAVKAQQDFNRDRELRLNLGPEVYEMYAAAKKKAP